MILEESPSGRIISVDEVKDQDENTESEQARDQEYLNQTS